MPRSKHRNPTYEAHVASRRARGLEPMTDGSLRERLWAIASLAVCIARHDGSAAYFWRSAWEILTESA